MSHAMTQILADIVSSYSLPTSFAYIAPILSQLVLLFHFGCLSYALPVVVHYHGDEFNVRVCSSTHSSHAMTHTMQMLADIVSIPLRQVLVT
jgi:hypothetical protein